jgi:hypothetical protein
MKNGTLTGDREMKENITGGMIRNAVRNEINRISEIGEAGIIDNVINALGAERESGLVIWISDTIYHMKD